VQTVQRVGHLARSAGDLAPGASVDVALDPSGNDFGAAMVSLGVGDERRNQQWLALHLAQHSGLS
jgi:hypothetical protein